MTADADSERAAVAKLQQEVADLAYLAFGVPGLQVSLLEPSEGIAAASVCYPSIAVPHAPAPSLGHVTYLYATGATGKEALEGLRAQLQQRQPEGERYPASWRLAKPLAFTAHGCAVELFETDSGWGYSVSSPDCTRSVTSGTIRAETDATSRQRAIIMADELAKEWGEES